MYSTFVDYSYVLGPTADYSRELVGRTACTRPSDFDGLRYCGDSVQAVATAIDKCGGFAGRDGVYKYLVTPACLQKQLRWGRRPHSYTRTRCSRGRLFPNNIFIALICVTVLSLTLSFRSYILFSMQSK